MPRLGWKKDAPKGPSDKPDLPAAPRLTMAAPPARASCLDLVLGILDQGQLGSCTANATAQALRAAQVREAASAGPRLVNPPLASRLWLYYLARAYDHDTANDDGAQIRNVFAAAVKFGFPPESVWPYSDDASPGAAFSRLPGPDAFRAAYDMRAPTVYRRIDSTGQARIDDIKRAIASRFLVVFGTPVSNAFCADQLSGPMLPPDGDIAGGHALCVAGYDGDVFDVVNSWGTGWGKGGLCKFASEYLAWDGTDDLWIVEHTPLPEAV